MVEQARGKTAVVSNQCMFNNSRYHYQMPSTLTLKKHYLQHRSEALTIHDTGKLWDLQVAKLYLLTCLIVPDTATI